MPSPAIENRFLCPHCRQKLACEDGYTGWQIQCPACQGAVIVPQPIPPPPPVTRASAAAALTPAERWRRVGILAVATLLFGLLNAPLAAYLLSGRLGLSHEAAPALRLVFTALGVAAFAGGAVGYWDSTRPVGWPVVGGLLALGFPLIIVGGVQAVVGFLGAGCSVMLGKGDQGITLFTESFVSFLVFSVVLSVWAGLFNALRSR